MSGSKVVEPDRSPIVLDLPGDDIAVRVAEAIAQKTGHAVIVSDCDGIELWRIGPKLPN